VAVAVNLPRVRKGLLVARRSCAILPPEWFLDVVR
jgi:hypothetical protein